MSKKNVSVFLFLIILSGSFFLFGCKHESIKFYRESAASDFVKKMKIGDDNDAKKRSSGIIILKDDSQNRNNSVNFGPKEIDFDMPIKIK